MNKERTELVKTIESDLLDSHNDHICIYEVPHGMIGTKYTDDLYSTSEALMCGKQVTYQEMREIADGYGLHMEDGEIYFIWPDLEFKGTLEEKQQCLIKAIHEITQISGA